MILSTLLSIFYYSPIIQDNVELRKMKIIDSLDNILPKSVIETIIVEYDKIKDYKTIYFQLMKEFNQEGNGDALDFFKDDFIDRLMKYLPKDYKILSNGSANQIITNLLVKWLV